MPAVVEDWADVMERLLDGDRRALAKVTRVIVGFMQRWNAFDFRDDWDDVVQEAVMATGTALREGRIRERDAVLGYLKHTARNKYVDRLKRHLRCGDVAALPWEDVVEGSLEPDSATERRRDELRRDLDHALDCLDEKHRQVVWAIHVEGQTYDEAAECLAVPRGTLKDRLRDGLAQLRRELERSAESAQERIRGDLRSDPQGEEGLG